MRILVVEDNSANQQFICEILGSMGNTPLPVASGEAAIQVFQQDRPDIILLSMALPDGSGPDVARRLRGLEAPSEWTPIIFLSARDNDQDLEEGILAGGDDYLHKPASEIVLRAKIRAMQRIVQMRCSLVVTSRQLDAANRELKLLSTADGLTGLANRRHFDDQMNREWRRSIRQTSHVGLILCDVDAFKAYNDFYGHQAGDDCLRLVADVISHALVRGGDMAARYGGEEFAIILPETGLEGARQVAERVRAAVASVAQPHEASPHGVVTISIGVAADIAMLGSRPEQLIGAADRALYSAKQTGRNRVCCTSSQQLA